MIAKSDHRTENGKTGEDIMATIRVYLKLAFVNSEACTDELRTRLKSDDGQYLEVHGTPTDPLLVWPKVDAKNISHLTYLDNVWAAAPQLGVYTQGRTHAEVSHDLIGGRDTWWIRIKAPGKPSLKKIYEGMRTGAISPTKRFVCS